MIDTKCFDPCCEYFEEVKRKKLVFTSREIDLTGSYNWAWQKQRVDVDERRKEGRKERVSSQ
jgi:hypothetical protein